MGKCDEASVEVNMGDSASPMKPDNFTFTVPPEAPVFEPTAEEFQDPLAYINKIRPIAEKSGICKIKPPKHWQPPFALDVDRLQFTPRIQRLNELEAITRVKLNFLDQIIKFWELQGSILKIPTVERKPLDLFSLHKIVGEAGGFDVCSTERKWSKIARRMAFPQGKGIGSILKNHYERILYPYDVFKSNGAIGDTKETKIELKPETPEKRVSTPRRRHATPPRATPPPRRRDPEVAEGSLTETLAAGVHECKTPIKEEKENSETRRSPRENKWMSSMGSGCGSRVTRSAKLREHRMSNMTVSVTPAARTADDPLAKYMCRVCGRGDVEEQMLLCDGCDDSYHTFCLAPPLEHVPKGDWRCPVCIAQEVSKPTEAFGFEQASREYTLQQFGEMADQFKSDYFNMPVHMVPTSTVEKEFWRVVSSIDEDVTVEYGADLHSMDHGSGFPTKSSANLYPGEQQYAESGWNLNNLPVSEGSVLCHIDADISGMKVPWLYVGMCFAAFCWHNEDHWSYSINYLHWGEPKTWYGVPGCKAEQFEAAMKAEAPELFQLQPDLLHQLVTIMNPNVLMKAGVPVYRLDQHAGEFVITFPRAYHAGFNQGYNFAEAVNFTPADWLKMGRECISHYSTLRRYCVFSHDELVCKMALAPEKLTLTVALAAYRDMRPLLHEERRLRKALLDWGVTKAERSIFELLPDDERQCHLCKTTCFLSCVECKCSERRACLKHCKELCECPPTALTLKYRYTLDELPAMLERLKSRSAQFRAWAAAATEALDPAAPNTCNLDGLRQLLQQANTLKIAKTDLVRALETAVADAEKCVSVIQQLDLNKMRTRTRQHDPKYRLTVEELTLFAEEIDQLACTLPEGSAVKEVLRQTEEFEKRAAEMLSEELKETDVNTLRTLEETVEMGSQLCIVLDHLPPLQARLAQVKWLEEVKGRGSNRGVKHTKDKMKQLLESAKDLPDAPLLHVVVARLHKSYAEVQDWDERAKSLLVEASECGRPHTTLQEVSDLLNEASSLPGEPDHLQALANACAHAEDWLAKVEEMQSKDLYPYYHTLEALVKKGLTIPLSLLEKDRLNAALESAQRWKQGAAKMFLKKNWTYTLMEALSPRTELPPPPRRRRPAAAAAAAADFLAHFNEKASPAEIVQAFKTAEAKEIQLIKDLRARNSLQDPRTAPPGTTFCTCGRKQYGNMTQCELCNMWMHASCLSANKESRSSSPESEREQSESRAQVLCGDCCRTKRPRLDKILSLLVWLQKLPVRLAEGEALQCVTERAMAWQDMARRALHQHREYTSREKSEQHSVTPGPELSQRPASSEHAYSAAPRPHAQRGPTPQAQLHALLIEGHALEVTLEEQRLVRQALYSYRGRGGAGGGRAPHRPPRRPRPTKRDHQPAKRARPGSSSSSKAGSTVKRGSATTTNYLNRKQSTSGSSLMMRKHYLARQQRRARSDRGRNNRPMGQGRVPRAAPPPPAPASTSSSSGDEDEDCAAPACLRPTGKEVDWVQCDGGCEAWFHMHCVGLKKDALRPDDDYVCGACAERRKNNQ